MLVNFFHVLKDTGVPVTPRELLDLLEAMERRLAFGDMDDFTRYPEQFSSRTRSTTIALIALLACIFRILRRSTM